MAASLFDQAAVAVGVLTAAEQVVDPSSILHGGQLGPQVQTRIASTSASARACQSRLQATANTCRLRAAIAAEYADQVAQYSAAYDHYTERYNQWYRELFLHWDYPDLYDYPDWPIPQEPLPPVKPFEWIDV